MALLQSPSRQMVTSWRRNTDTGAREPGHRPQSYTVKGAVAVQSAGLFGTARTKQADDMMQNQPQYHGSGMLFRARSLLGPD